MADQHSFDPIPGDANELAPAITRILAPNPSPLTYRGTNTYIVGMDRLVVIDPGPDSAAHLEALVTHIAGRPVTAILTTHSHLDHSPLAPALSAATGAPICGYGPSDTGLSPVMRQLLRDGDIGGDEGIDWQHRPNTLLKHTDTVESDVGPLRALHIPGHMGNHLAFLLGDTCFCGDHVMAWSSTIISPPFGDLTDFMTSCRTLLAENTRRLDPGHGPQIDDPKARIAALMAHRQTREGQILSALTRATTVFDITDIVYRDIAPHLRPAAARNVLAHLIDLTQRGDVRTSGPLSAQADFTRFT